MEEFYSMKVLKYRTTTYNGAIKTGMTSYSGGIVIATSVKN